MPRYKLTVAYDGTNFHGWQKQAPSGTEGDVLRTVQGVLEDAVCEVLREDLNVMGASRTDAGVHARGQVAAFTTKKDFPVDKLAYAVNSRLPDDVQVRRAEIVRDDFNPISDTVAKGYRYRLAHGCQKGVHRPLFDRCYTTWTAYALDPARMNEAARLLVGEHDFASFTRLHHGRESTVRTIFDCRVSVVSPHRCQLDVAGNGFLYNMIRIIMGTLLEVGRGRLDPDEIKEVLAAKDRRAAGATLPPEGLRLEWVRY